MTAGLAWYHKERVEFLHDPLNAVVEQLSSAAIDQRLHVEREQKEEWESSVGLLQAHLDEKARMVALLQKTLTSSDLRDYEHVILEYDLRRRGLRIDCVLLGKGIIVVIEFKRTAIVAAARDQVTDYCINLIEFHEETQRACRDDHCIVVPLLALTEGKLDRPASHTNDFHNPPWAAVARNPLYCDKDSLHEALRSALAMRHRHQPVEATRWLRARFSPSSTIIDAAISLWEQHDVSAIKAHDVPVQVIHDCTEEVREWINASKREKENRIIFVSGAPGAGKTLVGLKLVSPAYLTDGDLTCFAPRLVMGTRAVRRAS